MEHKGTKGAREVARHKGTKGAREVARRAGRRALPADNPPRLDREIRATCYGAEPRSFVGTFRCFDRRERLRRAAGRFLPLLGGALVSLPIPGWHFAGVPGFLIAAFVFGGRALREHSRLERLRGPCPSCGADQDYPAPDELAPDTRVTCPGCGEFIALSARDG